MKRLALAAAGAVAVVGLASCSQTAAPTGASASHGTVTTAVPVSCSQQYHKWENGQGKGLIAALNAVPAITRGARHPMPACADPRGYWDVLLMHVNAAIASGGSNVGAAMTDVPKIEHNLITELKTTAR
jgi:hypothetical protein